MRKCTAYNGGTVIDRRHCELVLTTKEGVRLALAGRLLKAAEGNIPPTPFSQASY